MIGADEYIPLSLICGVVFAYCSTAIANGYHWIMMVAVVLFAMIAWTGIVMTAFK